MYISPDDIDIVIVRYKETLKWLEYWDSPCPNIYVYNKYLDFSDIVDELTRERLGDALRIYNIENIGHEGSTYIYHILMFFRLRYPFKKITIFLQGNPFPHFSPFSK